MFPYLGKTLGTVFSFSTGHFRPCDLRREGSESQLTPLGGRSLLAHFWDMSGTSIWGYKDGLVLFNSTEIWNAWSYGLVPFLFGDNPWLQPKSYQLNVPPMTKSVSRGTKKLDTIPKKKHEIRGLCLSPTPKDNAGIFVSWDSTCKTPRPALPSISMASGGLENEGLSSQKGSRQFGGSMGVIYV